MQRIRLLLGLLCISLVYSDASAAQLCLSPSDARVAIVSESYEPYFSLLQHREIAAKLGRTVPAMPLVLQQDLARSEYGGAVQACSPAEEQALEHYVSVIRHSIQSRYPKLAAGPWQFMKVADTLEGGIPGTRGDTVVLSSSLLQIFASSDTAQTLNMELIELLIHEHIHVLQRHMAQAFAAVYTQEWGFERVASVTGSEEWLLNHQIVNPDGVDVNWIWPVPNSDRVIWPRVILSGEADTPSMPRDFAFVAIELKRESDGYHTIPDTDNVPRITDLQSEAQFMQKFGSVSSIYHPNEIAADMLTDLALFDCLIDKSRLPSDTLEAMEASLKPTRAWAIHIMGPAQ